MQTPRGGTRIWLMASMIDMRRSFGSLTAAVQLALNEDPFSFQLFVFRGKRGNHIEVLDEMAMVRARSQIVMNKTTSCGRKH
jgi:transposase